MAKGKLGFPFVLLAVFLIPAFLAPLIFPLLKTWFPFERVLSRMIMISAFLGVAYLMGGDFKLLEKYGFARDKTWVRWLFLGFVLGFATLLAAEAFETLLGAYKLGIRIAWARMPEKFLKAFFTGLLIGTTEEFFFRGFMFLSLTKLMGWKKSVILTNAVYALVHFFRGTQQAWVSPTVIDSFRVILNWFTLFGKWQDLLPQFIGLFFFGCILNYAFTKSGALYLPIGLHWGAVFFLKIDVMFFGATRQYPVWLYGGKDFYAGIIGWVFLSGLFMILVLTLRRNR